jgi:hypothetical protein
VADTRAQQRGEIERFEDDGAGHDLVSAGFPWAAYKLESESVVESETAL